MRIRPGLLVLAAAAVALTPAAAQAAAKPGVTTGGTAAITPTTAKLLGKVDPNGVQTGYYFQYGTTSKYGARTPTLDAGKGTSAVNAVGDVGALTPDVRYHYRLVASSSTGTSAGRDHTFTTRKQPLGLSLGATPNPVVFGGAVTLSGNLSGTGNGGRTIVVKQNPFPFTAGLQPFGNSIVTDAAGNFSVPILSVGAVTQYQASVADAPNVANPVFTLPVTVKVSTSANSTRIRRGRKLRLSGSVRPARSGLPVLLEKRKSTGGWAVVATTRTRRGSSSYAVYGRSVSVAHSGTYRVRVTSQGDLVTGEGQQVSVRRVR